MCDMRKSTPYLTVFLLSALFLLYLLCIHPAVDAVRNVRNIEVKRELAGKLYLTDLCLFTEARYTRHLSQSDLFSAFQDHPMSFEHFPSGSLIPPPPHLMVRTDGIAATKAGR